MHTYTTCITYLEARRKQLGFSQREVGRRAHINQAHISLMELRRLLPTDEQLTALGAVLGIPPQVVMREVPLAVPEPQEVAR